MPNAWGVELKHDLLNNTRQLNEEISGICAEFFKIPVKCPQKGKGKKVVSN